MSIIMIALDLLQLFTALFGMFVFWVLIKIDQTSDQVSYQTNFYKFVLCVMGTIAIGSIIHLATPL